MISFAVVYTIAVSCVCQLDYSPLELSKLVPKDAVELKIEGAELSDSETVVIKDVGTLKTGLTYFFKLPIYNLTDVPVKVEPGCRPRTAPHQLLEREACSAFAGGSVAVEEPGCRTKAATC